MYLGDEFYYDQAQFENAEYDFSKEIEEIEKKCEELQKKENLNKSNNFQSNVKKDDEYSSYIGIIKKLIENGTYKEKPTYSKKSIFTNENTVEIINSITKFTLVSPLELYYKMKYEFHNKISHDEDRCTICQDNLYEITKENNLVEVVKLNEELVKQYNVILLDKCKDHFFHIECLVSMIGSNNFIKCPNCLKIYGIQTGTQPNGSMSSFIEKGIKCSGFEKYNTIIIKYDFPSGKNYSGTSRVAYLPDNNEGRKVLGLLKVCFDRRLIFTVGTSVTTGKTNTTVWAGIHHKTNITGGPTQFGYPDPTYFDRIQQEIADKGVTEDSLDENPEAIAMKFLEGSSHSKLSLFY